MLTSCGENKPDYSKADLSGYCLNLYEIYAKKNEMLVLLGSSTESAIEKDRQGQLQFIYEELNADNDQCLNFLEAQMNDFLRS